MGEREGERCLHVVWPYETDALCGETPSGAVRCASSADNKELDDFTCSRCLELLGQSTTRLARWRELDAKRLVELHAVHHSEVSSRELKRLRSAMEKVWNEMSDAEQLILSREAINRLPSLIPSAKSKVEGETNDD